jgi:hypothetical protein
MGSIELIVDTKKIVPRHRVEDTPSKQIRDIISTMYTVDYKYIKQVLDAAGNITSTHQYTDIRSSPHQIIQGDDYIWIIVPGTPADLVPVVSPGLNLDQSDFSNAAVQYQRNGVIAIRKSDGAVYKCIPPEIGNVVPDAKTGLWPDVAETAGDPSKVSWKRNTTWQFDEDHITTSWSGDNLNPFETPYQLDGHPYDAYPVVMKLEVKDDVRVVPTPPKGQAPEAPLYPKQTEKIECLVLIGGFCITGILPELLRRMYVNDRHILGIPCGYMFRLICGTSMLRANQ